MESSNKTPSTAIPTTCLPIEAKPKEFVQVDVEYLNLLHKKCYPNAYARFPYINLSIFTWDAFNDFGIKKHDFEKVFAYYCFQIEHSSFRHYKKENCKRGKIQSRGDYSTYEYISDCCDSCILKVRKMKDENLPATVEVLQGHSANCLARVTRKIIGKDSRFGKGILRYHPDVIEYVLRSTGKWFDYVAFKKFLKEEVFIEKEYAKSFIQELVKVIRDPNADAARTSKKFNQVSNFTQAKKRKVDNTTAGDIEIRNGEQITKQDEPKKEFHT